MSAIADIRNALEAHVSNIVGVPSTPSVAAANDWENVLFTPDVDPVPVGFFRIRFAPTSRRPTDITATGVKRYDGLFLIDVFWPSNEGPNAADEKADAIIDAYDAGGTLTSNGVNVRLEYAERRAGAIFDPPWYQVPVSIKWKAFAA